MIWRRDVFEVRTVVVDEKSRNAIALIQLNVFKYLMLVSDIFMKIDISKAHAVKSSLLALIL